MAPEGGPTPEAPQALIVAGGGEGRANGVYIAKGQRCGAAVYEHADRGQSLLVTREPHASKKTGKTSHGWLLGAEGKPLYGAQTEALAPPSTGWRIFGGEEPLPSVQAFARVSEAYFAVVDEAWSQAEDAVDRGAWQAAEAIFTAGLEALKRAGASEGRELQSRALLLLAGRAQAHLSLKKPFEALRDAAAALGLSPGLERAEATAVAALLKLGCRDEAGARRLLARSAVEKALDAKKPWALRGVELWAQEAAEAARDGGPAEEKEEVKSPSEEVVPSHGASLQWLLDCEKNVEEEAAAEVAARRKERAAERAVANRCLHEVEPAKPKLVELRVRDEKGKEVTFRHGFTKPMRSWMESYCKCWGFERSQVAFRVDGLYDVDETDTPESMDLEGSALVEVISLRS